MVWFPSYSVGNQRRPNREVPGMGPSRSAEFEDYGIHRETVARFCVDFLYSAVDFRAQHVLHLHRLDNRHGLAGLDLLAFFHGDRNNETRHRTKDQFPGIADLLLRHQPRITRLAFSIDIGSAFNAPIAQRKTVRNGPHLHRNRAIIDRAAPDHIAWLPIGMELRTGGFVPLEANVDDTILAFDFELHLAITEPQSALAFARDALTIKLAGYAALALAQNVVNCGCYSGQYFTRLTLGCLRVKSPAKFFGNETGGEFSGLPAGMRHQRRQEGNVVADAVDD